MGSRQKFAKMSAEQELDEVESKVTTLLGTATAETLEECFGEIQLQVPPSAVGKRSTLLRTLNRYLNSAAVVESADEGLAVLKQVAAVLEGALGDGETDKEDSATKKGKVSVSLGTKQIKKEPCSGSSGAAAAGSAAKTEGVVTTVNLSKIREFKLNGTVGGLNPIPYCSLLFQIDNAQSSGFDDSAICAGVLKATAAGYLRTYLELKKDLTVDSLKEFLKVNFDSKDSGTLFSEMCKCGQKKNQEVEAFAYELFVLRERIMDLGEEEGCSYERQFLQRHLFRALSVGISNNNIRFDLKEMLDKREASDYELMKAICNLKCSSGS